MRGKSREVPGEIVSKTSGFHLYMGEVVRAEREAGVKQCSAGIWERFRVVLHSLDLFPPENGLAATDRCRK